MQRRAFFARLLGSFSGAWLALSLHYKPAFELVKPYDYFPGDINNWLRFPPWVCEGDIVMDLTTTERAHVIGKPVSVGSSLFRICPVRRGIGSASASSFQRHNACTVIGTVYREGYRRMVPTKTGPEMWTEATQLFPRDFVYL